MNKKLKTLEPWKKQRKAEADAIRKIRIKMYPPSQLSEEFKEKMKANHKGDWDESSGT